jgi:hypothetical protein
VTDAISEQLRFKEIEHKFVVDDGFDLDGFGTLLEALNPTRRTSLRVRDTYYLLEGSRTRRIVIRHRFDEELHHLTVKTLEADTEVRQEVNIDLGHHAGNQRAQVDAFLGQLGVKWSGVLQKDLIVWYFPDVEVVHYRATTDLRAVCCVEFEATRKPSVPEALETLRRYEDATGFRETPRSHRSLLHILFPEVVE